MWGDERKKIVYTHEIIRYAVEYMTRYMHRLFTE
jgi:hypothetical protein